MRIYISVDAEGMPGIFSNKQTSPEGDWYKDVREIMTDTTLWTCDELHKNGVDEIVVADSHDGMGNIYYEKMPEYVTLIRGSQRPVSMMHGVDRKFDGAIFLGYHAAAGVARSNFDHTYCGVCFSEIRINGVRASEFYFNLLVGSHYNVPVILVAGDQVLEDDVRDKAPWAEYVRFKESVSRFSNISPSLEKIEKDLREKVRKTVKERLPKAELVKLPKLTVEYVVKNTHTADVAELIPDIERTDAYTLKYVCDDAVKAYRMMELLVNLYKP